MRKQPIAVLLASILAISSAQAADAVRWEDLPKKIGNGGAREYTIVTKDRSIQKAQVQALDFSPTGVRLSYTSPAIPREDVAEIRIHRHRRMGDAAFEPVKKLFGTVVWFALIPPLAVVIIPAAVVTYVATAPPAVAVEGIRRLLPDQVIRVAP